MNSATFIGVDLAWKSERNPTGVAILQGDRQGARLIALSTISPEMSVANLVSANATADTVVAIDAPLIIVNQAGQRGCETAVGRRYGSREASCHTTNLRLYPAAASVALTAELVSEGFVHVDPMNPQLNGRKMAEVYPHAAMVALWNLPKTIKYKRGHVAENRIGLNTLRTHLSCLSNAEPPLRRNGILSELLSAELSQLSGRKLKDYEDQLDALFCAYLAYYFWYWRWERNEVFGDLDSGYILNPRLRQGDFTNDAMPGHNDSRNNDPTSRDAVANSRSMIENNMSIIAQAHQQKHSTHHSQEISSRYTSLQGQYLAFIYYYTRIHLYAPAEADMQAYFKVSPPSVHQMILTLESKGLIKRSPGEARSIRLLLAREDLPDLE